MSEVSEAATGKSKRNITIVVIVILILVGLYFVNRYWIAPATMQKRASAGKYPDAPEFSVTDIHGSELNLANYRGKVVLLSFWATWCGPCREETPGFVEMQRKYGPQGFQLIGISIDSSVDPVRPFYNEFHLNYPVAMSTSKLFALYLPHGIQGVPTNFLIGRDGRIYDEVVGEAGNAYWEKEIEELLAAPASTEARNFTPAAASAPPEVSTPAAADSPVPGIDVSHLSKAELAAYEAELTKEKCTCGCNYTVLECRIKDTSCAVSAQMAQEALVNLKKHAPAI